jgi:methylenetetrahydrofolate--tRNA-(uracil-5-)-methyltransferase
MLKEVSVIGAGLAGSEAAWQIANVGIHVKLYEMRPNKSTKAHQTEKFACTVTLDVSQLARKIKKISCKL